MTLTQEQKQTLLSLRDEVVYKIRMSQEASDQARLAQLKLQDIMNQLNLKSFELDVVVPQEETV